MPAEANVRYTVKVVDGDAADHWDNNGGKNFLALVNESPSSIRWFGNTVHSGIEVPVIDVSTGTDNQPTLLFDSLEVSGIYRVMRSGDLITWSNLEVVVANTASKALPLSGAGTDPAQRGFFCVEPDWIPLGPVYDDEEVIINVETWPIGGATAANLVYSMDGETTWDVVPMRHGGTLGDNDVWTAVLGAFPMGTIIQYAVEVIDDQAASQWDKNDGSDFTASVLDPAHNELLTHGYFHFGCHPGRYPLGNRLVGPRPNHLLHNRWQHPHHRQFGVFVGDYGYRCRQRG